MTCHDLRIPIGHSDPDNFHHFPLLEMSCWKEVLVSTQFVLYVVDLGEIKVSECCIYDQQSLHVLCRPSVQTKEHNVFIGQVRSEVSPQCAAAYILFSLLIVVTRKWNINDLLHSMPQSLCTFVILQVTHSFTDNFGKKKVYREWEYVHRECYILNNYVIINIHTGINQRTIILNEFLMFAPNGTVLLNNPLTNQEAFGFGAFQKYHVMCWKTVWHQSVFELLKWQLNQIFK